ncbi:DUF1990 family protein, partial [Micromonospora sp. NPDC005220]|uniref:DUF1990 family protein n=1 Tax=Micromonospora sp. NPDC005220 TaxID=3155589 RepID=UPI0033AFAD2C
MAELTYPEVGSTRHGPLPGGYHHLRHRIPLPAGCFETAADAVLSWRLHRAAGPTRSVAPRRSPTAWSAAPTPP